MLFYYRTRGPLVLYRSPECWGFDEVEQTWKYKSTQCSISCHPCRSIRNKFDPVIKMSSSTQGHHLKKATGHGHTTTWFWQHFKALIFPIILYQFQKDPFCLIILYDILFYFIHVYKAPGQEETTLGDNVFDASRKVLSHWSLVACFKKIALPSDFMHIFSWFYTCT